MKKYYIIITLITLLSFNASTPASAQKKVRELNRSGNLLYKKGDYKVAEIDFRKALEINSEDPIARYNLANTLYHTDRTQEAGKLYTESLKNIEQYTPDRQADLAHNAGNVFMKDKEYEKAVECYKASLRRRPSDEETRYNLALAQKLLEKEKQSGDSGGGQDDKQQDQNKDQQNQQQDQQQDQQQQDPQQQDQPQQPQEQQMSKENAEKILRAFLQDEKATQQKVDKQKQQSQSSSRQKNW